MSGEGGGSPAVVVKKPTQTPAGVIDHGTTIIYSWVAGAFRPAATAYAQLADLLRVHATVATSRKRVYTTEAMAMAKIPLVLFLLPSLMLACTSTSPTKQTARATPSLNQACQPASPWDKSATAPGLPEVHGSAPSGQLWALIFAPMPIVAGNDTKIAWRMTGNGPFNVTATDRDGNVISPDRGPDQHSGSSWLRPGNEWGTSFTFPAPGCWRVHATRSHIAGDVYFLVAGPSQGPSA